MQEEGALCICDDLNVAQNHPGLAAIVADNDNGKSNWTTVEDAMILMAVTGSTNRMRWSHLARQMPGLSGKQIRDRWNNCLNPKLDRTPFSREEDIALYEAYKKHGKRWVEISTRCFGGRRGGKQIRNR